MKNKQIPTLFILLMAPISLFCQDFTATITQTSSATANDGSISIAFSGGAPPYEIFWTGPTLSSFNNNATFVGNLPAGNYSAHFTDSRCGEADMDFTILRGTDPCTYSLDVASNIINPCSWTWNNSSGSITANPTNGSAPYNFSWSTGVTGTNIINNLWEGAYSVTVTDRNGCTGTSNYSLKGLDVGSINVEQLCINGGNNRVTINPVGGTPPYSYNWWGAGTGWISDATHDFFAWNPSSSYVSVKDANGCETWPREFSLRPLSDPLTINISSQYSCKPTFTGGTQAQINVNQGGGMPPFSYQWNDGNTQMTRYGLQPGSYQLTVTDARGCETTSNPISVDYPTFELSKFSSGCLSADMKIEVKSGWCGGCFYQLDDGNRGNLRISDYTTYFNMQIFPHQPATIGITDNNGCITRIDVPYISLPVSNAPIVNWRLDGNFCMARYACLQDPSIVYGIRTLPLDINLPFDGTEKPCELVEVTCNIDGSHDIGGTFNGQATLVNGATNYSGIIRELSGRDCLWSVTCLFEHPNTAVGVLKVKAQGIRNCFQLKNDDKPNNSSSFVKKMKKSLEVLSVMPNPFKDEINILIQSDKSSSMRINLVNQLGQVIDSKLTNIDRGYSQTQMLINQNLLSEGMYMLVITDNEGFRFVQRMIHIK
jgi:hypothetical protein